MRFHTSILALLAATALTACSGGEKVDTAEVKTDVEMVVKTVTLDEVLAHPRRAEDAKRDQFRNPKETLKFFEVGPGKRVGEIWPGWYTKATAPYLAANGGEYVAILYPEGVSEGLDKRIAAYKEAYADPEVYGEIEFAAFWGDDNPILAEGQEPLDVLVTYRNVHNWMGRGYAQEAFNKFYAALKPGGILGVVEHRLPETAVQDPKGSSGYVQESYMKDLAKQAGFEFIASSEINANPKDTADHPFGVWTLPPRSRLPKEGSVEAADFDAEAYKNIGESDRATLKFRKPK
jgi:predicted methyltransferase